MNFIRRHPGNALLILVIFLLVIVVIMSTLNTPVTHEAYEEQPYLINSTIDLENIMVGKSYCNQIGTYIVKWDYIQDNTVIVSDRQAVDEHFTLGAIGTWRTEEYRDQYTGATHIRMIATLGPNADAKKGTDARYVMFSSESAGFAHLCRQEDLVRPD